ncbi:MAG TPA: hypothetical protein VLG92_03430 [Candidatus Saccharimonadia bacterium]|nr:hypothetical protein [Candidatus Saccharimonadia bacterium]
MALLFIDGFDAKDTAKKWPTFGGTTSATTRFSSGSSVNMFNDGCFTQRYFTAASTIIVGFAHRQDSNSGANNSAFFMMQGDNGATLHMNLRLSGTQLQLFRGSTMVATANGLILPATWNYLEISATVDSTVGVCTVRCNNSTVISFSGNTRNGGTNTTIDAIGLNGQFQGGNTYYDDLYICNASGATNNTFLGDVRIQTLLPNGAGSSTQLAPTGSGTNYLNANEVPDSTATYNSSSTVGQRDTYAMGDLLAGTGNIFAVQQTMGAFKSDSGAASMKNAQKSGATVSYGATRSLGTSPAVYTDVFETNPATGSAYTASDVNALEGGAEVA